MESNQKLILFRKLTLNRHFLQISFLFRHFWPEIRGYSYEKYSPVVLMYNSVTTSPREPMESNQKLILARKLTLNRHFRQKCNIFR